MLEIISWPLEIPIASQIFPPTGPEDPVNLDCVQETQILSSTYKHRLIRLDLMKIMT